jgi:hypothetical protein
MSRWNAAGTIIGRIQFAWDVAPLRSGTAFDNFGNPVCDERVILARF